MIGILMTFNFQLECGLLLDSWVGLSAKMQSCIPESPPSHAVALFMP